MTAILRSDQKAGVLRLTLDDPSSRNSLSDGMMTALSAAFAKAENDASISVIVLAAIGPAFCSGHNLKELTASRSNSDSGAGYFNEIFSRCSSLMMQIAVHRCAVIAEVAGLASAAGCQLVASCDLAYAGRDARFCTPGVNIGLFCSTPMTALSRNVTSKHGLEMLLTGDIYDVEYAYRVGLVNAVIEPQNLTEHVDRVAQKISQKSSTAIAYGKKLYHAQQTMPLQEAYRACTEIMVANMLNASATEGIGAFLEKRHPHWPGTSKS